MFIPEAALLRQLKRERAQKRAKVPFKRTLFVKIHALVQEYGLEGDFLRKIDEFADNLSLEKPRYDQIPVKRNLEVPLFSLATPERYGLTLAIIEKVNNPYLPFANSPAEILACNSLFQRNPAIAPQTLAGYHFHTLLLCHHAQEEMQVLTQRLKEETFGPGGRRHSLQERLEQLEKFLASVHKLDPQRVDTHV
jgi:hypothetical protein